jgi:hypothetical protein
MISRRGHTDDANSYDVVVSLNILRRHLSLEQRRALIAACLKRAPERSDREHARLLNTDHTPCPL